MNMKNNLNKTWKSPKIIFLLFIFFVGILYLQYFHLSVFPTIYGIDMKQFAANRNTVSKTLVAERGKIYDANGNILAQDISSYTIILFLSESRTTNLEKPQHVVDFDLTAKSLAPILEISETYIKNILTNGKKNGLYQVELGPNGKNITELKKEEIQNLKLPGIGFTETISRNYPNGNFASYTVGYAKMNEVVTTDEEGNMSTANKLVGELGIESFYNDLLSGSDGYTTYQQDMYGYKIPDTPENTIPQEDGASVYLTIDTNIQRFVEDAVKDIETNYDPEWMMLTVMNPKTGDILGTSSIPSFNPNILDIENYENPLVSYIYEPGSTMKIYSYMCALEKGTYKGNETYLSGVYDYGENHINDWNRKGWGNITYDMGFQFSSNVAIANILQNFINKGDLRTCLNKFGFGTKTNIELPREMTGKVEFTYPIEVASAGFGQGITITAVQQLRAITMLANNGSEVTPHIVDKVVSAEGEVIYESVLEKTEPLIKESTLTKMKELMHNAIYGTEDGTAGTRYALEGYDIIGKTGTAQIFNTATGQYSLNSNDYIFSFVGMYPSNDPEVAIYTVLKRPKRSGGEALAKATNSVIQNVATYLNVFKKDVDSTKTDTYTVTSYINKKTDDMTKSLTEKDLKVITLGDGDKIINQYPVSGTKLIKGDLVILKTNSVEYKMPSIINLSRKDIINVSKLLNLDYELNGYGYATNQSIKKDTIIENNMILTVDLKEKFKIEGDLDVQTSVD